MTLEDRDNQPNPQEELIRKLERYNLSSFDHTFETFLHLAGTEEAYEIFYKIGNGESDRKFVLCYGITGSGKTHLIEATIITWLKRGLWARYYTMSEIIRELKRALQPNHIPSYDELFRLICNRERLIIDDYGMGTQETRFEVAELEDIINERYHKRYYPDNKVTILATNKDIRELPDRVTSRFYDPEFGVVVYMSAKDYRKRKK